jgi:DNA-binding SARP family transcriptional activator
MLRIRALGGLSVERDGTRLLGAAAQPRRMALLAMIARAGDRGISRDRLQSTLEMAIALLAVPAITTGEVT